MHGRREALGDRGPLRDEVKRLARQIQRLERDLSDQLSRMGPFTAELPPLPSRKRGNVVLTRIADHDLELVDVLVGLGLYGSRSEAVAYLVREGIATKKATYEKLRVTLAEIVKLRDHARRLLEEVRE